ncbi:hypothetical protein L3Y34_009449 [Caenorhabditis briggsae]|uniref:DUF38 domain-containing protein n=1 Tax=Caenorhabditis briggsae TaxID=6238 RepID=A0AAE9D2G3_CAEBR|nr:hypothetical protein L3Y34_009449 [Caenorhabditis briggsae]
MFSVNVLCNQFNHAMDNFIETDRKLQGIVIEVDDSGVVLRQLFSDSKLSVLRFKKHPSGCIVKTEDEKRTVKGIDFISKAFQALNTILDSNESPISEFGFILEHNYFNRMVTYPVHNEAVKKLNEILRSRSGFLEVETFHMHSEKLEHYLQILPFLHPMVLKKLSLVNIGEEEEKLEIREFMKLHQWQNLEEVEIVNWFLEANIRDFCHLNRGKFDIWTISADDVIFMRETFLQAPKEFIVNFQNFENQEQLLATVGPPLQFEASRYQWIFEVPNDKTQVLCINLSPHSLQFSYIEK